MPPSRGSTATKPAAKAEPKRETAIEQYQARGQHPIVAYIDEQMPNIVPVLPRAANAERFKATLLQALINNPDVLQASFPTIIRAVIQAAQEGIPITGQPGGAYLVNMGGEAVLMRDYRALTRMAIRSGAARKIEARAVREGDHFLYQLGTEPRIEHVPLIGNDAEAHTFYAIAWLPNGDTLPEVMTRKQVDHVRSKSRQKDGKPWREDYDQMARKTVIRRLMNYLDLSPEQREALAYEERMEYGDLDLAPVARVSPVPQHGDLRERAAQRAALLTGGTEQPAQGERTADASSPPGGESATTPAPVSKAEDPAPSAAPESEPAAAPTRGSTTEAAPVTLEDATKAVYAAAAERGVLEGATGQEAWTRIDVLAREAIPGADPEELAVADWQAILERIRAGEFDQPTARPRSAS